MSAGGMWETLGLQTGMLQEDPDGASSGLLNSGVESHADHGDPAHEVSGGNKISKWATIVLGIFWQRM